MNNPIDKINNPVSKIRSFIMLVLIFTVFSCISVFADEAKEYVTTTRVNFRETASTDGNIIATLNSGATVQVSSYQENGWSAVSYNGYDGYVKSEYILTTEDYASSAKNNVELIDWSAAKDIFTVGVDAKVYDVRTGLTYYVRSFSNGLHADVEPVTKEDTATMLKTYGGRWEWDPRPVFVTINGRTMAASINGMPHGGGVNNDNGMNGQVCIHFKGSKTHNGNKAFERDHQDAIIEAWNAR